jgi:truncated hemoglobin YjbI
MTVADTTPISTRAEWAGGPGAPLRLTEAFHAKVPDDPVLALVFAQTDGVALVGYLE